MANGQLLGKGYRKAYASRGDDMRTRFVRVAQEPGTERKRRVNKPRLPGFEAAFIQEGRTKFPKSVKKPDRHILVSGHNNIKIGKVVRKGHLRGYYIFTLSLEERKSCPASCQHWQTCYGNNMPFAKRVDHTDPQFLPTLEAAIKLRASQAKKRGSGILIRLHALGDFYSPEYVGFWRRMLVKFTNLSIYGYTARNNEDDIGPAVFKLRRDFGLRAMIRSSNGERHNMNTVTIGSVESRPKTAFICPEQTGKTLGCDTCAACWATTKTVAFLEH